MAITNATILMRRGNYVDFDPTKMTAGEWAVSIDADSSKRIVWMCFSAGVVKRIGTYEDLSADMQEQLEPYIARFDEQLAICTTKASEAKANADSAKASADSAASSKNAAASSASAASSSAGAAAGSAQEAATSATGAQNYYQMTEDAIAANIPQFTMNLTNGHLSFTGGTMLFQINSAGHLGWEVTV